MNDAELPFFTRIWFALACWLRILLDGQFAARVWQVRRAALPAEQASGEGVALPVKAVAEVEREPDVDGEPELEPVATEAAEAGTDPRSALVFLGILQREGRLVDFLEQDIQSFDDAEVGAAARVVHEGCRRALRSHAEIRTVRSEDEESRVVVAPGFASHETKLTGHVSGEPPYHGVLRHRGWRIEQLELPTVLAGHDPAVVAPAEVEL